MRSGIGNSASDPVFVSTVNGGSGGGGGPVTVADGADVAQGSTTDAQATSGTGAWTIVALLKGILTGILAPTPAGTATIGKVTVTGTGGDAATAAYSVDNATGGNTFGVRALAYLHGLNSSGNADRVTVRNPNGDSLSSMNGAMNTYSINAIFNGTSWDRLKKPSAVTRVASSAASGNPAFAKASLCDVSLFWGMNGSVITYLQIYNKATAPVLGTDVPVATYPIAANAMFNQQFPNGGLYLSTGCAFAFTTDAAGTTGAAAGAVTAFAIMVS